VTPLVIFFSLAEEKLNTSIVFNGMKGTANREDTNQLKEKKS
jgi:hypothetical protein